jgi:hypothetical protein
VGQGSSAPAPVGARRAVDRLLALVVGAVLMAAALLKGYQLAVTGTASGGLALSTEAWTAWVGFEWVLGSLLVLGLLRRILRPLAVVTFIALAGLSLSQAIEGAKSCGCFGVVPVNPWWTLGFDALAATALLLIRPGPRARSSSSRATAFVGGAIALTAAGIGLAILTGPHPTWPMPSALMAKSRPLEPQRWVGSPLPLLAEVQPADRLSRGRWIVLLYRKRCPHCIEATPQYIRLAQESAARPDAPRVALLQLPPYETGDPPGADGPPLWRMRLSDPTPWIGRTPVEIQLDEGRVTGVKVLGEPAARAPATIPGLVWLDDARPRASSAALVRWTAGQHP